MTDLTPAQFNAIVKALDLPILAPHGAHLVAPPTEVIIDLLLAKIDALKLELARSEFAA